MRVPGLPLQRILEILPVGDADHRQPLLRCDLVALHAGGVDPGEGDEIGVLAQCVFVKTGRDVRGQSALEVAALVVRRPRMLQRPCFDRVDRFRGTDDVAGEVLFQPVGESAELAVGLRGEALVGHGVEQGERQEDHPHHRADGQQGDVGDGQRLPFGEQGNS